LFCFAPAVLIILMSPAMLQITEFMNPANRNNPLADNDRLGTERITNTLGSLNQDISAANRRPGLAPPPRGPAINPSRSTWAQR
jgi:hypothetical protein